jgi:hypothetical protein
MLYIFHILCHFVTKTFIHVRQYIALLFYVILWSEQKCVAGNIMKNSKVYCLVSVCSCFVIILMFYIFSTVINSSSYCIAGGCFTDVVLHSSKNYHQEDATESRRLPKTVAAAWSVVILRFHGVANIYKLK